MGKRECLIVGVVGCGKISDIYLKNMTENFPVLKVKSCCAVHPEHARKKAQQYGIAACTYEEMLADPQIDMVVILTPAPTHASLIRQALAAGKHVYTEKPIALTVEEAAELSALAEESGKYLCAAPDTFLGSALQTARRAVDEGEIGEITGFTVNANRCQDLMTVILPNNNLPGGGVGLNYGIYYMTALISLLGPVEEVSALVRNPKPVRINRLPGHPDFGKEYASPNESQIAASLRMGNGVIGTFFLNGESILSDLALFCLYGTKGVLRLTDANQFGGQVTLIKNTSDYFHPEEIPLDYGLPYEKDSRGVGPAEMAAAILSGRESRTDKAMAIHVLDVFCAMERSSEKGRRAVVNSTCRRPEAFREGIKLLRL